MLEAFESEVQNVRALPLDVTDLQAIRTAANEAFGDDAPDLAIFNAGTYFPDEAETLDADAFRRTVDVNLMGVAHGLEAVLPGMVARGSGQIVIVSSVAGYRGLPRAASYGATKAALINLAESLRMDLGPRGILVQVVNPGFIDTPLTEKNDFPMPFLMPLDKAAEAFMAGISTSRFEITFPKRFTWILKAMRHLPNALYLRMVGSATVRRKS